MSLSFGEAHGANTLRVCLQRLSCKAGSGTFCLFANVWGCVSWWRVWAVRFAVRFHRDTTGTCGLFGLDSQRGISALWTVLHCRGFHNLGDLVMALRWPYKAWERDKRRMVHAMRNKTVWRFAESLLAFRAFYFQRAVMYSTSPTELPAFVFISRALPYLCATACAKAPGVTLSSSSRPFSHQRVTWRANHANSQSRCQDDTALDWPRSSDWLADAPWRRRTCRSRSSRVVLKAFTRYTSPQRAMSSIFFTSMLDPPCVVL